MKRKNSCELLMNTQSNFLAQRKNKIKYSQFFINKKIFQKIDISGPLILSNWSVLLLTKYDKNIDNSTSTLIKKLISLQEGLRNVQNKGTTGRGYVHEYKQLNYITKHC